MWNIGSIIFSALGGVGLLGVLAYVKYPWLKYDIIWLRGMATLFSAYHRMARKNKFLIDIMEEKTAENPKKTMVIFNDQSYSYQFMNSQMNKISRIAGDIGLKSGETVTMLMHNSPAFMWTYLGFVKLGVEPSFLNYNLRAKSLLHCFNVSESKILFMGAEPDLIAAIQEILPQLQEKKVIIYVQGGNQNDLPDGFQALDERLEKTSDAQAPASSRKHIGVKDTLCYIYTSGTTGLPKAAIVSHGKSLKAGLFLHPISTSNEQEIIYTALPLYHSAAGLVGIGCTIVNGCTMVLRQKFSASAFWDDCRKHNVTVIQYVGELTRFLTSRPRSSDDSNNSVKIAMGNGMRQDIWREFQQRFGVDNILEFYAATEGNAGFLNFFNKEGVIGRCSPIMQMVYPMSFIRYDYETAEPVRGPDGFCMKVSKLGEPGLMVAKIKKDMEYEGYKGNRELSEKKILRDVKQKGDAYFNTGDLIYSDSEHFVYFSDRLGDTFRWKGENVSTTEVSNVVADLSWIHDANVYGVEIHDQEGKAGMAAIMLNEKQDELTEPQLAEIYTKCEDLLPSYARPRFLRLKETIEMTGTFKNRKVEAVKEGYDPAKCAGNKLYVIDAGKKTYRSLTSDVFEDINAGKFRL